MIHRSPSRAGSAAPALAIALSLSLAGCISVLPKSPPVQLYRFGATSSAVPPVNGSTRALVAARVVAFDPAAAGDRILTVDGMTAAQIAGVRWVSPAQTLFQEALDQSLDTSGGALVRVGRGENVAPAYRLDLDVQKFEARVSTGEGTPEAQIVVRATLERADNPAARRDRTFSVDVPAQANRVGAIVAALDAATRQILGEITAWAQPA
ncbi:MAG TPA: ABC-type transport auxiliary lipoprotein family protein [Caulobacteraceae bacterium]|jgi:cholesterol transport system auxiliary component|nr:ABC-type transport auxiliary lipoprotein family protein [Caulobacteraceae bacterium]